MDHDFGGLFWKGISWIMILGDCFGRESPFHRRI